MSKILNIDERLYEVIKKSKKQLVDAGVENPSWSNATRALMDLPLIVGTGVHVIVVKKKRVQCDCGEILLPKDETCKNCGKSREDDEDVKTTNDR